MLQLTIPGEEFYNEKLGEFITTENVTLKLEHSLLSISKWESKWEIPFLNDDKLNPKTNEMILDYIRCMSITPIKDEVLARINQTIYNQISDYISSKQSATTFNEKGSEKPNKEIITSEVIYYWMAAYQIPFDCEKWHINRLLNLIKIYSIKNAPPDKQPKVGKRQQAVDRAKLNAERRKALNTRG